MEAVRDALAPRTGDDLDLAEQARLVSGLCRQRRQHVARLRCIQTSLEMNDLEPVMSLAGAANDLAHSYSLVASRVGVRRVASLLVGKAAVARRRGLDLSFDPRTRLTRLPTTLDETQAVSLVGNLLENALDAVAGMAGDRRRVRLLLSDADGQVRVRVRDWGSGLARVSDDVLLSLGFTTKPGHSGVGLDIVRRLAEDGGGTLAIERLAPGTAVEVVIPGD